MNNSFENSIENVIDLYHSAIKNKTDQFTQLMREVARCSESLKSQLSSNQLETEFVANDVSEAELAPEIVENWQKYLANMKAIQVAFMNMKSQIESKNLELKIAQAKLDHIEPICTTFTIKEHDKIQDLDNAPAMNNEKKKSLQEGAKGIITNKASPFIKDHNTDSVKVQNIGFDQKDNPCLGSNQRSPDTLMIGEVDQTHNGLLQSDKLTDKNSQEEKGNFDNEIDDKAKELIIEIKSITDGIRNKVKQLIQMKYQKEANLVVKEIISVLQSDIQDTPEQGLNSENLWSLGLFDKPAKDDKGGINFDPDDKAFGILKSEIQLLNDNLKSFNQKYDQMVTNRDKPDILNNEPNEIFNKLTSIQLFIKDIETSLQDNKDLPAKGQKNKFLDVLFKELKFTENPGEKIGSDLANYYLYQKLNALFGFNNTNEYSLKIFKKHLDISYLGLTTIVMIALDFLEVASVLQKNIPDWECQRQVREQVSSYSQCLKSFQEEFGKTISTEYRNQFTIYTYKERIEKMNEIKKSFEKIYENHKTIIGKLNEYCK